MDSSPQKQNASVDLFLNQFGKTLSRIRLYSLKHPMVNESIQGTYDSLSSVLQEQKELTLTLTDDKFLANGVVSPALASIASILTTLFEKYSLQSLSFLSGLSSEEFNSFLKFLASPKEITNLKSALEEENIQHIAVNSAVYAKVTEGHESGAGSGSGLGDGSGEGGSGSTQTLSTKGKEWFEKLEEQPLENILWEVVKKSIPDSNVQKKIYDLILKQIQGEMETYVERATEGLKKEKQQLVNDQVKTKSVINNFAVGTVMVNEKGEVVMTNEGAEKILGLQLSELKGKTLAQISKDELMISLANEIAPSKEGETAQVSVQALESTQQTIQNATAMVQNPEGKVVGMVSILQDIAKIKELQRMQDDFISHITHELRSPLTSIKAALGTVLETSSKDAQQEQILNIANKNADRLGRLINDLLDVSKIGAGKMTVNPKPTASENLLKDSVQSLESWAKMKEIQLSFESKGNLPYLLVDPDRTTQIVVNLISNAIKFTPAKGTIRVQAIPVGSSYLKILVTDSGPGMNKEAQKHLFERFYQAKQLTKSDAPGTGLGLYIAKTLVELQKGHIGLESEEGKGTTFYFTLPTTPEPQAAPKTTIQETIPSKKSWFSKLFGK